MKRLATLLLALVGLITLSSAMNPTLVRAFDINNPAGTNSTVCSKGSAASSSAYCNETTSKRNPLYGNGSYILIAADVLSLAGGVAAVILIVIGGLKYATSGGDSSASASARSSIINAVVGIIIIAVAQAILRFVLYWIYK